MLLTWFRMKALTIKHLLKPRGAVMTIVICIQQEVSQNIDKGRIQEFFAGEAHSELTRQKKNGHHLKMVLTYQQSALTSTKKKVIT